eukprot:1365851-Rhodomonas_salina.1
MMSATATASARQFSVGTQGNRSGLLQLYQGTQYAAYAGSSSSTNASTSSSIRSSTQSTTLCATTTTS